MKPGSVTAVASGVATDFRGLRTAGTFEAVGRVANQWRNITNIIDYYWADDVYWVRFKRMHPDGRGGVEFDVPAETITLLAPALIF